MKIIPYVQVDGAWSLPDSVMIGLWDKMVLENTSKRVFCTGTVKTEAEFLKLMKAPTNSVMTQWIEDEPAFIGWINNFTPCSAMIHFNCFKNIWGRKTVEAMKAALKYYFSFKDGNRHLFDTIVGMIPSDNKLAILLTQKAGAIGLGTIPDYAVNTYTEEKTGLYICYIKREEVEAWAE